MSSKISTPHSYTSVPLLLLLLLMLLLCSCSFISSFVIETSISPSSDSIEDVRVQVLVSGLSSIAATKSVEMIGYKTVALSLMLVVAGLLMAYLTVLRTEGPHMMPLGTTDRNLRTGNLGHRLDHEDHFTRLLKLYKLKMEALQKVTQKTQEPYSICTNSLPSDEECVDLNCVHTEPASLPARLHSVIDTMNASNVETLNRIMQLKELQVKPTGKRLLFITAASSNHYLEFQAMLKNFHETVAPNFSNYSLIFYDIGLTLQERAEVKKYCNCEVKTFPVLKMEYWMQKLTCYTWKPLIVQANIKAADIQVWMDASVRLTMLGLMETLQDVQIQGMVIRQGKGSLAQHTDTRMMSYFNTTSCVYSPYKISSAGYIFLHNEQFVRDAVVRPWAVCAVSRNCMCPENSQRYCKPIIRKYGKCHRQDQAGLSMILVNLYGKYIENIRLTKLSYKIKRGDKFEYFRLPETKTVKT